MKVLNCPQCGASLEYERIERATVRCHYCNSTVVVPAELRPHTPTPPREELQTSFGANERPGKLALTVVALLLLAGGIGLLVVSQKGADDELVLLGGDGRAARRTHRFVSSLLDKRLEIEALRVAVDARGRVYVCEGFDRLHVYAADGRYLRTLKTPHAVDALTFDARNGLYVAGGNRVSKLVPGE